MLVLQATNAGARRPGYEAIPKLQLIIRVDYSNLKREHGESFSDGV